MNKKITLKSVMIYISLGIILLMAILILILGIASRKPRAAFYGISDKNRNAIESVLQTTIVRKNKKSKPFETMTIDNSISLKKALKKAKKPDVLFIYNGLNADYAVSLAVKTNCLFETDVLKGMTTSVRQATPYWNKKVSAVPLLIDHYETDVHLAKFNSSRVQNINILADISELAKLTKSSTFAPIAFAAGEDETLINVFAALVEATSGRKNLDSAITKIKDSIAVGKSSKTAFQNLLTELTAPEGEFHEAFKLIKEWEDSKILPKNFTKLKKHDIDAFIQSGLSTVAFISLSDHRASDRNAITKYSSVYIPGMKMSEDRNFMAPMIFAVQLKKGKKVKAAIEKLASELQQQLCTKTGLAPVQASCGVPDKQSDDVRYWVAASGTPMPAFSDAAFTNKPNRSAFADALRSLF